MFCLGSCALKSDYNVVVKPSALVHGRKSVFNIGGHNLELRSIFRSLETLEGMIDNFYAKNCYYNF